MEQIEKQGIQKGIYIGFILLTIYFVNTIMSM
jgi:hypothetical protein